MTAPLDDKVLTDYLDFAFYWSIFNQLAASNPPGLAHLVLQVWMLAPVSDQISAWKTYLAKHVTIHARHLSQVHLLPPWFRPFGYLLRHLLKELSLLEVQIPS